MLDSKNKKRIFFLPFGEWFLLLSVVIKKLLGHISSPKVAPYILISLMGIGIFAPITFIAASFITIGDCKHVTNFLCLESKKQEITEAVHPHSPSAGWPHSGPFGTYDRAALQRGFQVYKQVCSNCHSLKLVAYRDLQKIGFNADEVKAIASEYQVTDGPDDNGNMFQRPARPSDHFVPPFANDNAARAANNGALPPDQSLIVKARHGNEDYIYSLVTGYGLTPQVGERVADGMYYNPYFPGHQIAMPPPLSEGLVTYADGTKASVEQMARDVVQFLAWASEPEMEARKATGTKALVFLIVFAAFSYALKRSLWKKLH